MDYETAALGATMRCMARKQVRQSRLWGLSELLAGGEPDPRLIESIPRQLERARLLERYDLAPALGVDNNASRKLFEAIIGADDMLPRRFLAQGEAAARAVGRIVASIPGSGDRYGTGALVGSHLVMTNNHVLDSSAVASNAALELGFFEGTPQAASTAWQSFRLRPDFFFYTSEALDFTLVGVEGESGTRTTADYGYLPLLATSGKALVGEHVNIVQHAGGRPQTISIRENAVVDVFDQWLHYTTDTAPGSSGAPVFNDEWQLVALHHAAVPVDTAGAGQVVINEGIRISAIWQDLQAAFA
ncbi:trypsin-like serine peptidase [Chitinimonas sp. JJ19]|uniref:trypsin-like serine peptidase n=1 Tax=Chitinimonas sp. JJ19 TaxID=3109352 RepID=UPI0030028BC6